jgi:hypothetical protein
MLREIRATIEARDAENTIYQPVPEVVVHVYPVAQGSYLTTEEMALGRPAGASAEIIELSAVRAVSESASVEPEVAADPAPEAV